VEGRTNYHHHHVEVLISSVEGGEEKPVRWLSTAEGLRYYITSLLRRGELSDTGVPN